MSEIRWRGFAGDALATFVRQTLSIGLILISSVLVARLLGPEGKGLVALAFLLPTFISHFGSLDIQASNMFLLRRHSSPPEVVFGNSLVMGALLGGISLAIGAIIGLGMGDRVLPGVPPIFVAMGLLMIPSRLVWRYLDGILWGMDSIRAANVVGILEESVRLALLIVLVAWLGWGVGGAILAQVAGIVSMVVAAGIVVRRMVREIRWRLDRTYLREALRYGLKFTFANAVTVLNYRLDMFLVNLFLNPAAVGIYAVSVMIGERAWAVSEAAGPLVFPKVSGMRDESSRVSFTPVVARNILWLSAALGVGLMLLAGPLVNVLYGPAFSAAIPALWWLIPGMVTGSITRVLGNDLAGRGRPMLNGYAGLVALIVNVLANALLIPRFGVVGASMATSISYTLDASLRVLLYWRVSGISPRQFLLLQGEDFSLYRRLLRWSGTASS